MLMNNPDTKQNGSNASGAITFAVTALVFLAIGCMMLAGRPDFLLGETLTGHGKAWINLMIFGFGLPAVFGAVYWALPQAFGVPLFSAKSVFLHYGFHIAGLLIVIVTAFVPELPQALMGTTFIASGGVIFVVNVAMSLRAMQRPDAGSAFISTVLVWLVIALFLGVPFAIQAPLPMLGGTNWSAGWLVFVMAGVFFNAQFGLALRVTPLVIGSKHERTPAAWYALSIVNLGVAWMFAATTFGPMPFLLLCTTAFLVGALVYLGDFWAILQRRPSGDLGWDSKILLTSVWMIPATGLLLIYNAWERMAIEPAVLPDGAAAAVVEESAGAAPIMVMSLDWTLGLTALLATAVPGLVAVIFQIQKLQTGGTADGAGSSKSQRVAGQLLLASFFNYAVGAGLVVVGAWGVEEQMLSLGSVFLVVGALGFLGNFLYNLGQSAVAAPALGEPTLA